MYQPKREVGLIIRLIIPVFLFASFTYHGIPVDKENRKKPERAEKSKIEITNPIRIETTAKDILVDTSKQYSDSDDGITYKIHIGTFKNQLSQDELRQLYDGNMDINRINERGWNKYFIGSFDTFLEADKYKAQLNNKNTFIVAITDSVKVEYLSSKNQGKFNDRQKYNKASNSSGELRYKVQIVANRVMMSEARLRNIYRGSEIIEGIEEGGWYRYTIGNYKTMEEALRLKKSAKVAGSFVVAYRDGRKVPLDLKKQSKVKEVSVPDRIVFKVQIAASNAPIGSQKLRTIYSGRKKIHQFKEGGWYKYSIGEYKTFQEAREVLKTCGVNGAFIIAFKGNKKINALEAKRISEL